MESEFIGTSYGGFYYPKRLPFLNQSSVVYCFGAGEDILHDVTLSARLKCPVHIFDPTPRAIDHVALVKDVLDGKTQPKADKRFGGGDPNYWNKITSQKADTKKLVMHSYGLFTKDATVPFYFPTNKEYVSCSITSIGRSNESIEVPVKCLKTIMKELNHDHIDLFKIDIENVECDVLEQMIRDKIFPRYISVDFDSIHHNSAKCMEVIRKLIRNHYRLIKKTGQDMSFIRVK